MEFGCPAVFARRWTTSVALLAVAFVALLAGCTYDSSLQGVRCTDEGAQSDGRVCQNGLWIEVADARLDSDQPTDATDADKPDTSPDTDAEQCAPNQISCEGTCIDPQTSEDHCGGCNQACSTYGSHSIALCRQGGCERTCEEGWIDADGDWINSDDPAASNGCEAVCDPTEEICDGQDNDCDGEIDEDVTTTYYLDADDDGFGVSPDPIEACAPENLYRATQGGDCDDSAFSINPDATESCNGLDDNCDSDTDEGCPCNGDETAPCYTAEGSTAGVGICQQGTKTCNGQGSWGTCKNEVTPQTEACDDGQDNDCDGDTDCADSDCAGQSCGGDDVCFSGSCCAPQSDADFCAAQAIECGEVSGTDNCGQPRTVDCGGCGGGASCTANSCQESACDNGSDDDGDNLGDCADPDCLGQQCNGGVCHDDGTGPICCSVGKDEFCADRCGNITEINRCGQQQSEGCGGCGGGLTCSNNTCVESSCDDGQDNDNDGDIDCADSDCPGSPTTYYLDTDDDGFGASSSIVGCAPESNFTATVSGDCDDNHDKTFPGAAEEEFSVACTRDDDEDGWGDAMPPGGVTAGTDCDDNDNNVHPAAAEQCEDGMDSDCDGEDDTADADADTWCSNNEGPSAGCATDPSGGSCCLNPSGSNCK